MNDLYFYSLLAFILGYLIARDKKEKPIHKISHKCKVHYCNLRSANTVCFERGEGELWVKEYANGSLKEGRTFRVNFCPWCGIGSKNAMALDFHMDNSNE